MTRVITRIVGGLGNQLFCYSAARRLALISGAELVIDDISGFARDYIYQRQYQLDHFNIAGRKASAAERLEPFARVRRYVERFRNRRRPFEERTYIQQEGIDFDPRLLRVKASGTIYLEGYWQSEEYFKDIEATIRSDLEINPPTDQTNLAVLACIQGCLAVAVHVRFFDVQGGANVNNASSAYYERAIANIEDHFDGAHYFLFSDRPVEARGLLPLPDERVTCVSHNHGDSNASADLWLMSNCQHFIIANSTFSWWGAWLAKNETKHVIAPGMMIGVGGSDITAWGFKGQLPAVWTKI